MTDESNQVEDFLPHYYKQIFPANLFQNWLSYHDTTESEDNYFSRREFSFTLPGDIFVRYKSFNNGVELTKALVAAVPIKFDIGAVYSCNPQYAKKALKNTVLPLEKELVFDIDMNDYDEIRKCCQGAVMCPKCWRFMAIAAKILDTHLRHDFGFKHILWVFSGRRGIHCWVCDEKARRLANDAREAIITYLSIIEGGAYKTKRVNLSGKNSKLHPMIIKSVELIQPYFEHILEEQGILKTKEDVLSFSTLFGNTQVQNLIRVIGSKNDYWSNKSPIGKYEEMAAIAASHFRAAMHDLGKFYDQEIKLQYCYPRLDVNVTKGINHLLKAPFCVHPKTGRVCIPFDINDVDSFNPSTVPTIKQVLEDKAALDSTMKLFTKFVNDLRADRIAMAKKASAKSLEF